MARRALILATGNYDDAELPPLASPVPDGLRLRDLFIRADVGGYAVTLCEDPDLRTARLAIEDFFDDGQRDDLNFVLISGHGLKDARGNLHFAMRDTRRKRLSASGLDAHYVRERMRDSRTRQQILCIDTCFSGAFPSDMVPKSGLLNVTAEDLGADGATGTAFITASDSVTVAIEREVAGRTQSVFTRHLIEGIESGAADTQGDGRILLDELFLYVKNQVIAEIPTQTPKIINGFDGPITIARNPNYRAVELPAALRRRMVSKVRVQRGMAIEQLHALASKGGRESPLALEALRRLARDDSDIVRRAAQESLDELTGERVDSEEASHDPAIAEPVKPPLTIEHFLRDTPSPSAPPTSVEPDLPEPVQPPVSVPSSSPKPQPEVEPPAGPEATGVIKEVEDGTLTPKRMLPLVITVIGALILLFAVFVWQPGSRPVANETAVEATAMDAMPAPELYGPGSPSVDNNPVPQNSDVDRNLVGRWYPEGLTVEECSTATSGVVATIEVAQDGALTLNGNAQKRGSATMAEPEWREFGGAWFQRSGENLLIAQKPEPAAATRYRKCP